MSRTVSAHPRCVESDGRPALRSPCTSVTEFVCHRAVAQVGSSGDSMTAPDLNNDARVQDFPGWRFSKMTPTWTGVA